jgi:opacity protein-like surface antigen
MGLKAIWLSLSALSVGLAGAASAQESSGWYASAGGTLSLREDTDGTIADAPTPGNTVRTRNTFEPGYGGQLAIGRGFGQFRLEGELGYARESQDMYTALTPATGRIFADVEEETLRLMLNGYVDFDAGAVRPYLGAGVGYASVDVQFVGSRAPFPTEQPRLLIDDSDAGFAWQVMAGASVPVNERVSFTLQYRWFDAGEFEAVDTRNEAVRREHAGHNIDVGLRLSF